MPDNPILHTLLKKQPPALAQAAFAALPAEFRKLTGDVVFRVDDFASDEVLDELLGLGANEMFRYADGVNRVTAEEVQAQARKWLPLDRAVLAITQP